MGLILDTNFSIHAEWEARHRKVSGRADAFLLHRPNAVLYITFTVAGELACGQSASMRWDWEKLCRPYPVLPWTMEVDWQYGELYRFLASKGQLIGTNDLWIAATALTYGHGVVTNDQSEFGRVPGLVVETY